MNEEQRKIFGICTDWNKFNEFTKGPQPRKMGTITVDRLEKVLKIYDSLKFKEKPTEMDRRLLGWFQACLNNEGHVCPNQEFELAKLATPPEIEASNDWLGKKEKEEKSITCPPKESSFVVKLRDFD